MVLGAKGSWLSPLRHRTVFQLNEGKEAQLFCLAYSRCSVYVEFSGQAEQAWGAGREMLKIHPEEQSEIALRGSRASHAESLVPPLGLSARSCRSTLSHGVPLQPGLTLSHGVPLQPGLARYRLMNV